MLALTRCAGERIFIGPDIMVQVVRFSVHNGEPRVVLGIEAPREVRIVRDNAGCRNPQPAREARP